MTNYSAMKNVLLLILLFCAARLEATPFPPVLPPVTGTLTVCSGQNTTLANATAGGAWTSTNIAVATIDGTTGVVTGVAAGTATISYTVGADVATEVVTVNATPNAITGSSSVCVGASATLASTTTGGTWLSSIPGIATIGSSSGSVSGVSAGVLVVSYTAGGCSSTYLITINALPFAGGITGTDNVCTGNTMLLSNTTTGGSWSSANTAIATVGTGGTVTGVSAGATHISYTVTNTCGSSSVSYQITVNTLPATGAITGNAPLCVANTLALGNVVTGGVWTSVNTAIATIGTSGVVTGVAAGIDTISYTTTNVCGSNTITDIVTVNPLPAAITGAGTVCNGMTITLSNDTTGGTWSSTSNATVGSATGIVTALHIGTATISYTMPTGCRATKVVTVSTSPKVITGTKNICQGFTVALSDTTTGGTWSTAGANISVGGATGVVAGITTGTAIVSYTIANGCYVTTTVTVNLSPGPITGDTSVCRLITAPLTNTVAGGTWSSSSTVVAIVGSITGVVTGMTVGTARITYKMPGNCIATTTMTVLTAPQPVTGTLTFCEGATTTLSSTTYGGVWISSNTAVAAVVTPTGVVAGVSAGTSAVSYALANGCFKSAVVTVNPLPASITGTTTVCAGRTTTLATTSTGGLWSTSGSNVTIGSASAIVTGISAGTAVVTYRIAATGCRKTTIITVNETPAAIAGTTSVCEAATTLLSSTPITGTWTSADTSVATIGVAAGLAAGVHAGSTTITYTLPVGGCYKVATVNVNPLPAPITGPASVCEGSSITMASTTTGGSWTSGAPTVATAAVSSGVVTGVSAGTTNITYTIGSGCKRTTVLTVNSLPSPGLIAVPGSVCQTATVTIAATVPGGTWSASSGHTSVSSTGVVLGVSGGADTITYTVTGVCGSSTVSQTITVNPLPDSGTIVGINDVCVGGTTTLSHSLHSGTWSIAGGSVATVSAVGEVAGLAAGTAIVTYTRTNSCGSSYATTIVTVHVLANAGAITGIDSMCMGDTSTLINATGGGTWVSASSWVASLVAGTGKIKALFPGTAVIMYVVSNVCSADTSYHTVVVKTQLQCETAVKETTAGAVAFRLYPNPAGSVMTVETPVAGTLTVVSPDGRVTGQYKVQGAATQITMPAGTAAGIYFCRFAGADGSSATVKLVYEP